MRRPLSVFCLLTAAVIWLSVLLLPPESPDHLLPEGKTVTLSGKVEKVELTAEETESGCLSCRIVLRGTPQQPAVMLQYTGSGIPCPGDLLKVRGTYRVFRKASNEGEFDAAAYYRALGISGQLADAEIYSRKAGRGPAAALDRLLFRVKLACGETVDRCFAQEDAGLMRTLLLGERKMADEEVLSLYRRGGILHLLVISGMHISLLGTALYFLARWLRCPPAACACLAGAGVILYGRTAGMTSGVFRAVMMFVMRLLAPRFGRTYDMTTAVSAAAAVILFTHPLLILQSGFLLSFSAVFGLALLAPALPEKLSFAAVPAAVLPVQLWFFYGYAPYGVILTLMFAPFLPVLAVSGITVCLLGSFFPAAGRAAAVPAHLVFLFFRTAAGTAEKLPGAFLITGRPSAWKIAVYYGMVFFSLYIGQGTGSGIRRERGVTRRDRIRAAGRYALRFLGMAASAVFLMIHVENGCTVSFLDVGQGDGICVQEGSTAVLIDGGSSSRQELGKYVLIPFLKYKGISGLEMIILTHEDYDHCNGMLEILGQAGEPGGIRVKSVALPEVAPEARGEKYRAIEQLAENKGISVLYYRRGDVLTAGEMRMECLHPFSGAKYGDANEGSGVFLLRRGSFSALLTGDLEGAGEEELVRLLKKTGPLDLTVLKAAHHGSGGSTGNAFLKYVHADYAVISCGQNNRYGHPAQETVDRLENAGFRILDTRECGEIVFKENRGRLSVFCPMQ